jgi:hypothetical protein
VIVAPGAVEKAVGVAALADQAHAAAGPDWTKAASHIVRGAIDDLHSGSAGLPATATTSTAPDLKICAAAAVDPDAAAVITPGSTEIAW